MTDPAVSPARRPAEHLITLALVIASGATLTMLVLLLLESVQLDSPLLPAILVYWAAVAAALLALGLCFLATVRSGEIPARALVAIAAALTALLIAGTFLLRVVDRLV